VLESRRMRIEDEYWDREDATSNRLRNLARVMTAMQPAAVPELARAIDNYEKEQVE
jgi:hypothetical protein